MLYAKTCCYLETEMRTVQKMLSRMLRKEMLGCSRRLHHTPRHSYTIPCHLHDQRRDNHNLHSYPRRQWILETKGALRGEVSADATALLGLSDADRDPDVPSQSKPPSIAPDDSSPNKDGDAASTAPAAGSAPTASAAPRSPAARGPRRRQYGTQSTKLEAVDDPLGPLGAATPPAGREAAPPAPPQKEAAASRNARLAPDASGSSLRGLMDSVNLDDDAAEQPRAQGPRVPPPVQAPAGNAPQRQTQPSVSVEQAAKPSFNISVGDPHKVGDLTSSHTEYSVTTKTTSKGYRNSDFTVSRRYRDFLWLYTQLHNNNPGVIIPPPPEKQAVGRFEADFVESRRAALERMLNKSAAHPILQHDGDLKLFLESDAFTVDIKNKERKDPGLGESKGMFGSMLSSSSGKFVEHDDVRLTLPNI
jgi:sorting nexin-1/2